MNWSSPILILATTFVAVFMEGAFNGGRHLLGAQIDLLPVLMVYVALTSSLEMVMAIAALGGLWFDSLSVNPLGVSVMPLLFIGCLINARQPLLLRDQTFVQFVIGAGAGFAHPVLTLLLLLTLHQGPQLGWDTLWQIIVMSVGAGVLTPVCFWVMDRLHHALMYKAVVHTSFRPDREIRRGRN